MELTKKCISWNSKDYQRTVELQDLGTRSHDWILEKKASVGPCFRRGMPFEGPSGITIFVPKKSSRCENNPSGININVSRKWLPNESKFQNVNSQGKKNLCQEKRFKLTSPDNKMNCEIAYAKFFNTLKGKMNSIGSKFKCVFNLQN